MVQYFFRMVLGSAVAAVALCASPSGSVSAQSATDSVLATSNWSYGGAVGLPGYGSQTDMRLFVVAFQATQIEPGRLGGDFSIGTMPRVLFEGAVPLGARAGLVLPVAISATNVFLPSGGASFIGAFGSDGAGTAFGFNAGIAVLMGRVQGSGLKVGATWHQFRSFDSAVWLFEIGIMGKAPNRSSGNP